jgi:hypothetical protein
MDLLLLFGLIPAAKVYEIVAQALPSIEFVMYAALV